MFYVRNIEIYVALEYMNIYIYIVYMYIKKQ